MKAKVTLFPNNIITSEHIISATKAWFGHVTPNASREGKPYQTQTSTRALHLQNTSNHANGSVTNNQF